MLSVGDVDDEADVDGSPDITPRRSDVVISLAIPILVGLALIWPLFSVGLPAGDDVPYHAAKNAFFVDEIIGNARLDGWSPQFNAGSQQHLLYGPGLAMFAAVLWAITLGTASTGTILAWVAALSFVATGPAAWFLARTLGFRLSGAAMAGVLALTVSVPMGGGLRGTVGTGLIPHQMAIPLTLMLLATLIHVIEDPRRRWITASAFLGMFLFVTHPMSAAIAGVIFIVMLLLSTFVRRPAWSAVRRLSMTAALTVGLGAWWLVPLVAANGPRPDVPSWGTPPLLDVSDR